MGLVRLPRSRGRGLAVAIVQPVACPSLADGDGASYRSTVRNDAKLERRLLQVVFDRFHQTGEWPLVDVLRHELDLADDDLDVVMVGQRLEPALGRVEIGYQGRASLTIHGVALCSGAQEELTDSLQTMRYAYARFRANGPGARFDSEDLSRDLGFDGIRIRRTYELIQWLPGIGGGGPVSPDNWYREIVAEITRFRRVETIADVLEAAPRPGGANAWTSGSLGSKPVVKRTRATKQVPSVFISYAHEDKGLVRGLADALRLRGCRVWVDEGEMRAGDVLIDRIASAIGEMEFLIAIVSEASVQSSWCQRELSIAISGALAQAKVKVMPVRLGPTALPATLTGIYSPRLDPAAIDDTADKLVADMRSHKGERPKSVSFQPPARARAVDAVSEGPGRVQRDRDRRNPQTPTSRSGSSALTRRASPGPGLMGREAAPCMRVTTQSHAVRALGAGVSGGLGSPAPVHDDAPSRHRLGVW